MQYAKRQRLLVARPRWTLYLTQRVLRVQEEYFDSKNILGASCKTLAAPSLFARRGIRFAARIRRPQAPTGPHSSEKHLTAHLRPALQDDTRPAPCYKNQLPEPQGDQGRPQARPRDEGPAGGLLGRVEEKDAAHVLRETVVAHARLARGGHDSVWKSNSPRHRRISTQA